MGSFGPLIDMKIIPILLALTLFPLPAFARYSQPGYSRQCFRNVYREQYVPGTQGRPGYVRRWNERKEVPCYNAGADGYYTPRGDTRPMPWHSDGPPYETRGPVDIDDNSCIEGSILGGIGGGAIGGAAATQENWIWSIPTGIIGGALIGCQLDGG